LHTIGFDISLDLLATAAQKGGGDVYNASDATELKTAFNQIILNTISTEGTFTAPAVTVSAFNQLQHRNEVYYALFKPVSTPRWAGNIKRYAIADDGSVIDARGNGAIDPSTGYFNDNAKSYWSSTVDGSYVDKGGLGADWVGCYYRGH